MTEPDAVDEYTIDELARRADMTVRNVRAYASRGLIAPPRLAGRTGYYNQQHLQRLQLVRQLLNRGFTLAAVEDAILKSPQTAPGHALELITILGGREDTDPSEVMARAELAALAGVERDDLLFDALPRLGLAEIIDEDHLRILNPAMVRPGAAARAMGLSSHAIIEIVPVIQSHLRAIAGEVVDHVSDDVVQPFIDAGLPEEDWDRVLGVVEALIPIASQVVLAAFTPVLAEAIDVQVGKKLAELAERADHLEP